MRGKNSILRRAEAEMVDPQVGQGQGVFTMLRPKDLNPRAVLAQQCVSYWMVAPPHRG
jgi:hypothetical protein